MSKNCQITSKRPMTGNHVSHANNKVKRRFLPNLRKIKVYLPSEKRKITLKISSSGLRTLEENIFISSTSVREIIKRGGDISNLVPKQVKSIIEQGRKLCH